MPIRATVWGENVHEQKNKAVAENYPKGMHGQIAALLNEDQNIQATTVTLQDPEHGMTEARLDETDVLLWWGHAAHDKVDDAIVERVVQPVGRRCRIRWPHERDRPRDYPPACHRRRPRCGVPACDVRRPVPRRGDAVGASRGAAGRAPR